ncbi:spinster family MFS transporter [Novosphingobium resinovorum]|jgi:MFS family permease|uniref:spinster family MFS transporter n=1 Tax=Novosphingobium resinovorum TaxID=158500 RepID=UPI0022F27297|nr:MFS transporter [Novosphingobium resinovorum]GLK44728.1 MFS transporter [Novosphingobium resinovorum]
MNGSVSGAAVALAEPEEQATPLPEDTEPAPTAAAWYLIFVLTLTYTASFVDRQVLNLLVAPLKTDFGLSDTRLSLLQGVAFTAAYILFSPLFGRLADTGSRKRILIGGSILWSLGTSLCGLARGYWQLFFARAAVGGAEASVTPAAWSIIADSFPTRMIPRAFSIFLMGPYIGGGLALIFGGLLLEAAQGWDLSAVPYLGALRPWQVVFLVAGIPGVLIALMMLRIREPVRKLAPRDSAQMPFAQVWRTFTDRRDFYGNFYAGMASLVIVLYAFPAWMPAMLMRRFGASAATVGVQYGVAVLVTGSIGVLAGPMVADWLRRRGHHDALMRVPFFAALALIPISLALAFAPSYEFAMVVATLASFTYSLPQALASSGLQMATPNRMRGISSSVYVFVASVMGLGAAPTIVALLTDHVFADERSVGLSLSVTCAAAAGVSAFFVGRALKGYRRVLALQ